MSQRALTIAVTRALLLVSFGFDVFTLLGVRWFALSEAWLAAPWVPSLGFDHGSTADWGIRLLWGALAWLLLVPLAPLKLSSRSISRHLLRASGVLIIFTLVLATYGPGPSKVAALLAALRALVMASTAILLVIRIQPDALDVPLEEPPVGTAAVELVAPRAPEGLMRRWWYFRSEPSRGDWLFAGLMVTASMPLAFRFIGQRSEEAAFRALDDCLARAEISCARAAQTRLNQLGAEGPRAQVAELGIQLLAEGWTQPVANALEALQAGAAPGLARAEVLLAMGDAAAAHANGPLARQHWAGARGLGLDASIEARLIRLAAQEEARARAERDAQGASQLEAETRRAAEEARRFEEGQRRDQTNRAMARSALGSIQADFEAAFEDAREGRSDSLHIRLRVLSESTSGLTALATLRIQAAIQALGQAGSKASSLARSKEERARMYAANYPQSYLKQRIAELMARESAEREQFEDALRLAREQFDLALDVLNGLPVEPVATPSLRVVPLGGR